MNKPICRGGDPTAGESVQDALCHRITFSSTTADKAYEIGCGVPLKQPRLWQLPYGTF